MRNMNPFEWDVLEHLVLPHFIPRPPRIKIITIPIEDLYCRIIESQNASPVAHPLTQSPYYKYILGDKDTAKRYIKDKFGTKNPEAKLLEFETLVQDFEYLSDRYQYNYICTYERNGKYYILDGHHRACILKHRGVQQLPVVVFLQPRFKRLKKLHRMLRRKKKF